MNQPVDQSAAPEDTESMGTMTEEPDKQEYAVPVVTLLNEWPKSSSMKTTATPASSGKAKDLTLTTLRSANARKE